MTDEAKTNNAARLVARDWLTDKYFESLSTTAATNVQYLNTAVAWSLSLFTGGLAVVFTRENFPDPITIVTLSILLIVLGHFFVRACKAYTNMMRFTSLEKLIVESQINPRSTTDIVEAVRDYHVNWMSPLPRRVIFTKVMLELGFAYFFVLIAGLLIWACIEVPMTSGLYAIAFLSAAAVIVELGYIFTISPYFKKAKSIGLAREQR